MVDALPSAITIIGLGIIGGSLAKALLESTTTAHLTLVDTDNDTCEKAKNLGADVKVTQNLEEAVEQADIVVIATPICSINATVKNSILHMKKGAILTDVASVKHGVIESSVIPEWVTYIPAHPIAGSELSGFAGADAALFNGKRVILTPDNPEDKAVGMIAALWKQCGADIAFMPSDVHDKIYAYVSHLPQLLAFVAGNTIPSRIADGADGTFATFMRISNSSPALWKDIFAANTLYLREALQRFLHMMEIMQVELETEEQTEDSIKDSAPLYTQLLPRLIGSCLIATITQAEAELQFSLKPYAGSGFQDFIAPLHSPPEDDLEHISASHRQMVCILQEYIGKLHELGYEYHLIARRS